MRDSLNDTWGWLAVLPQGQGSYHAKSAVAARFVGSLPLWRQRRVGVPLKPTGTGGENNARLGAGRCLTLL
jgi:hypothetical protein